jgi:PAS domain S-box-containing protein
LRLADTVDSAMVTQSLLNDLQVSATNRLLEALVESENRMRQRLDLLAEVVFELDAAGRVVFLNRAWVAMMGDAAPTLMEQVFRLQVLPDDRPLFDAALSGAARTAEGRRTVLRFQRDGGSMLWAELTVVQISGGHVCALHDITEQRRVQDQLEYIARYDVLTRMPNRTLLSDRTASVPGHMQAAWQRAGRGVSGSGWIQGHQRQLRSRRGRSTARGFGGPD